MVNKTVHDTLVASVAECDWAQFHTTENLAKSVAIEAGGLLECFQWSAEADPKRVQEELADLLTYCSLLAIRIGADPDQIVLEKLKVTRKKYPVDKARGNSAKYDELSNCAGRILQSCCCNMEAPRRETWQLAYRVCVG